MVHSAPYCSALCCVLLVLLSTFSSVSSTSPAGSFDSYITRGQTPRDPRCSAGNDVTSGGCSTPVYRWYHVVADNECVLTPGCSRQRGFDTKSECQRACFCSQPAFTGPCRARMPRYAYQPATDSCRQFTYGGCLANKNNFRSRDACMSFCRAR